MPVVDIHTHVYPPSYMNVLRSRTTVPYVRTFPPSTSLRLVILPSEDSSSSQSSTTLRGRPIGPEYHSIPHKISFMDAHGIDISVISLANPWLDFLPPSIAAATARQVNDDINASCAEYPGRLFAFGALPLSASDTGEIASEVERLEEMEYIRGVIMGTSGLGSGLDDERLDVVYAALQESGLVVFIHPHYGLQGEVFGPRSAEYGHVLPLALGFPLETTIAVSRMILSGVWDRFPNLNVILAHSGGTLPFLAGRLESCIAHDAHLMKECESSGQRRRSVWDILQKNIMLDAVVYSEVGLKAAVGVAGADRVMFGTDHPFFPPLQLGEAGEVEVDLDRKWLSVTTNYKAAKAAFRPGENDKVEGILGGNAMRILRLGS